MMAIHNQGNGKYDRAVKGRLYAQAGIPDHWIINLQDGLIEVYTEPSGGSYKQDRKAHRGDMLTLPAELGDAVEVSICSPQGITGPATS